MSKLLIVYGSTTGNTEMVAEQISDNLEDQSPTVQDVADTKPADLEAADVLILGSSTWDDGLLQADFRDFAENLDVDLSGKKIAIFGLGDTNYPDFCEAAPILEKLVDKLGGETMVTTMKIDGFPDEEANQTKIDEWSEKIKAAL